MKGETISDSADSLNEEFWSMRLDYRMRPTNVVLKWNLSLGPPYLCVYMQRWQTARIEPSISYPWAKPLTSKQFLHTRTIHLSTETGSYNANASTRIQKFKVCFKIWDELTIWSTALRVLKMLKMIVKAIQSSNRHDSDTRLCSHNMAWLMYHSLPQ